jgi:hypothetical protein
MGLRGQGVCTTVGLRENDCRHTATAHGVFQWMKNDIMRTAMKATVPSTAVAEVNAL